jgi:hypothetical protein
MGISGMSRGPGRWQRLLLHELYHNPRPPRFFDSEPSISPRAFATTESENSAVYRAARGLIAKGLVRPWRFGDSEYAHTLYQVTPTPDISCPECGRKCSELATNADNSEHLQPVAQPPALPWVAT